MKNISKSAVILVILQMITGHIWSQRGDIQYFRPYDQRGINIFETPKNDTAAFDGLKLRIGANFTQGFQSLSHSNTSSIPLYELAPGFPLAQANLNIDVQLEDGIHLNLVSYMASHHHNEMWVKGGFVQIDKVSFLKSEVM